MLLQTIDRLLAQAHNALKVAEDAVNDGNDTYTQLLATKASLQSKYTADWPEIATGLDNRYVN